MAFDRPRFLRVYSFFVYAFLFLPIAVVVLFSFNSVKSLQSFQGFSLQWYEEFLNDSTLRESLFVSLEIAVITMIVATLLGTALAIGLVRARTRWSPAANVLMLIPLVTPEIVAGISALIIFSQLGIQLSFWTIVIAHITFSISYVTIVVRGRLASMGDEVEQAAMDLGATRFGAVRLVLIPRALAGGRGGGAACLRALVRRLRDLVLHHWRGRSAAARAHLVGDPLWCLADDQRDRDADDGRLDHGRHRRGPAAAILRAQGERHQGADRTGEWIGV